MRTSFAAAIAGVFALTAASSALAAAKDYRFQLAGTPQKEGKDTSVVSVKLVHLPDNKPISGAIIIQTKADMAPIGMAAMGAPAKALPEQPPGTYRFEIPNGTVWKKPDNWELTLDAKVQGEPETVHGRIVVRLEP